MTELEQVVQAIHVVNFWNEADPSKHVGLKHDLQEALDMVRKEIEDKQVRDE